MRRLRHPRPAAGRRAFTLVELLVVVAVVGTLAALLLPATQAARETARRSTCQSALRQWGLAAQSHLDARRRLPSGGWSFSWGPDPDRGFHTGQPGGWVYSLLPFVEQQALADLGRGLADAPKREAMRRLAQSPLAILHCPSRRPAALYPYTGTVAVRNAEPAADVAKSDYAASSGDAVVRVDGPASLDEGDFAFDWSAARLATGAIPPHGGLRAAEIVDGLSATLLVGEKRCLDSGYDWGDDQHAFVGHGTDVSRTASVQFPLAPDGPNPLDKSFGSAHPTGASFAMADGAVRVLGYDIDPAAYGRLANRHDDQLP